jgi:hypothetical protein
MSKTKKTIEIKTIANNLYVEVGDSFLKFFREGNGEIYFEFSNQNNYVGKKFTKKDLIELADRLKSFATENI